MSGAGLVNGLQMIATSAASTNWTEALQSVDYKWRMGKEAGATSINSPIPHQLSISEHSINRNTEVDLASQMPLTALITGALAQALRMILHAPAELATQCGAKFL